VKRPCLRLRSKIGTIHAPCKSISSAQPGSVQLGSRHRLEPGLRQRDRSPDRPVAVASADARRARDAIAGDGRPAHGDRRSGNGRDAGSGQGRSGSGRDHARGWNRDGGWGWGWGWSLGTGWHHPQRQPGKECRDARDCDCVCLFHRRSPCGPPIRSLPSVDRGPAALPGHGVTSAREGRSTSRREREGTTSSGGLSGVRSRRPNPLPVQHGVRA